MKRCQIFLEDLQIVLKIPIKSAVNRNYALKVNKEWLLEDIHHESHLPVEIDFQLKNPEN